MLRDGVFYYDKEKFLASTCSTLSKYMSYVTSLKFSLNKKGSEAQRNFKGWITVGGLKD